MEFCHLLRALTRLLQLVGVRLTKEEMAGKNTVICKEEAEKELNMFIYQHRNFLEDKRSTNEHETLTPGRIHIQKQPII